MILVHLEVCEIVCTVSLVSRRMLAACRCPTLWKQQFQRRWNTAVEEDDLKTTNFYRSYRNAHLHPHDLWVTHENIVHPSDGVVPYRCCILEKGSLPESDPVEEGKLRKGCVECQGQADTIQQHPKEHVLSDREAFSCAGTFHRRLEVEQFEIGSALHFLTDVLFFNLTDPATEEGQWEVEQLLEEAHAATSDEETHPDESFQPGDLILHEVAHHSWHVVRFANPDYHRPILFSIGIQRLDCFTVFPTEGYLPPGQSQWITIGVRPLGSALAYAFEALNVQRDGAGVWADLYTEEAHLPMVPIMIRYHFCCDFQPIQTQQDDSQRPQHRVERAIDEDVTWQNQSVHARRTKRILDYYRNQKSASPSSIRYIGLSAHVHAHYDLPTFRLSTASMYSQVVAPHLREWYFPLYKTISLSFPSRSLSSACEDTQTVSNKGTLNSFLLQQSQDLELYNRRWNVIFSNLERCIRLLQSDEGLTGQPSKLSMLLVTIVRILLAFKAAPWLPKEKLQQVVQWEAIVDAAYRQIPVGGEEWIPWRMAGVFKYKVCTDSVFSPDAELTCADQTLWINEPDYLDAFRHLAHSPGIYCLGPQEDCNHLGETVIATNSRYARVQQGSTTDMFMNSPIFAFQAAFCMMRDIRSLLGHGVYDYIAYPGSVVRRPLLDATTPDIIGHMQLDNSKETEQSLRQSIELNNFKHSLPPPGIGQYPLCCFKSPGSQEIIPFLPEHSPTEYTVHESSAAAAPFFRQRPHRIAPVGNHRGTPFLRIMWAMGARLGLAVIDDNPHTASVYVDRKILIASQWVSISLMVAPLFWTLCARFLRFIPTEPVDYTLDSMPNSYSNNMRFLSRSECGAVAIALACIWLVLGRWMERNVGRDYFRVMLEHTSTAVKHQWLQRQWDWLCPLFLQRRTFVPQWNRRTSNDVIRHIAAWRSRHSIGATAPLRVESLLLDDATTTSDISPTTKMMIGCVNAFGSFCSSTPHFWLNLVTVFSGSISLGMSVSNSSIEMGRSAITLQSVESLIKSSNVVTIVILALLLGQLVGSSGGTMFLAEFIVTSISFLFGGVGVRCT